MLGAAAGAMLSCSASPCLPAPSSRRRGTYGSPHHCNPKHKTRVGVSTALFGVSVMIRLLTSPHSVVGFAGSLQKPALGAQLVFNRLSLHRLLLGERMERSGSRFAWKTCVCPRQRGCHSLWKGLHPTSCSPDTLTDNKDELPLGSQQTTRVQAPWRQSVWGERSQNWAEPPKRPPTGTPRVTLWPGVGQPHSGQGPAGCPQPSPRGLPSMAGGAALRGTGGPGEPGRAAGRAGGGGGGGERQQPATGLGGGAGRPQRVRRAEPSRAGPGWACWRG